MDDPRAQAHVRDTMRVVTFLGAGYLVSFLIILILSRIMQARDSHGFEYGGVQWKQIAIRASLLLTFVWIALRTVSNTLDMGAVLDFVPTFPFESLFYDARYEARNEAYKQHLMQKYYKKNYKNKNVQKLGHPDLFALQMPDQPGIGNLAIGSPEPAFQKIQPGNPYILLGGDAKKKNVAKAPQNAILPPIEPNYKQAAVGKVKDAAYGAYAAAVQVAKKGPGGRNSHIGKGKGGKYGYGFKKNGKPAKKPGRPPKGKEKKKKKHLKRRSSD